MRDKKLLIYILPLLILGVIGCMNTKENMPKTEQSADTKKERDYGSKENPASIDEKIIVDFDYYQSDNSSKIVNSKIEINLSNYITGEEAYNQLLIASPLNKKAPEGFQWIIFDASITMLEGSNKHPFNSFPLIKSISSNIETSPSVPAYVLEDKIRDYPLYEGETISGKIAGYIPLKEGFTIQYIDNINSVKDVVQSKHNFKIELYFNGV
ncbi:hypothetical protein [Carnobacterium inhibens]|uniref:hypothetical protein n=1 Tax=Carnobacterium inhibens TaxID=147709 RepID=UPI000552A9B3|nr:hypothetical protein [Carnobacterium inhibens]